MLDLVQLRNGVTEVTTSLTQDVMLDFDLSRSFVVQGNPDTPAGIQGFHFKPVVRAVNVSDAGSLTFRVASDNGTADDPSDDIFLNGADYTVSDPAMADDPVVAGGASGIHPDDPAVEGFVFHAAISAGSYELELSHAGHVTDTTPVEIIAGNLTDLGVIRLEGVTAAP
jgi:hypothetical protein